MKMNNYYKTSDLSLATTISLFIPLWCIDKSNPQKAEFYFERSSDIDNLVESFWRGDLKVDPLKYFNQLKNIKSRLYENK